MKQLISLSSLLLLCNFFSWGQYSIQGILLDSLNKYDEVVLEYLPSIRGLTSLNTDNIVNSAIIDSSGYFYLSGNDLPNEKRLYRLSLQEDRSIGTGIATGTRKNYMTIVLDNTTDIELKSCTNISSSFQDCLVLGSPESAYIQQFDDVVLGGFAKDKWQLYQNKSALKESFIQQKHIEFLKKYCDTVEYLIPAMIAFVHIDQWRLEMKNEPSFFLRFKERIVKESPHSLRR